MSIEIINKGQTKFIMNCKYCDCRFSYELEDIKTSYAYPLIDCPNCSKSCKHSDRERPARNLIDEISYGYYNVKPSAINNDNNDNNNPCVNCWFYRNVLKNNPMYVGDTPCGTCSYHQDKYVWQTKI